VTYNDWLEKKVLDSQAAVAQGKIASDEEVRRWIELREKT
jgi:hypothetical protein